jgi:hypothetical protein
MMDQALKQGEVRCYGSGLLPTYLRVKFRHNAREDDVRDALVMLDAAGTESRQQGSAKQHARREFIVPGLD